MLTTNSSVFTVLLKHRLTIFLDQTPETHLFSISVGLVYRGHVFASTRNEEGEEGDSITSLAHHKSEPNLRVQHSHVLHVGMNFQFMLRVRHIFTYFLCYSIGSASNNKKLHCSPSFIRKNCKEQWYTRDDNRKIFETFNLQGNVYWHTKMQIWKKSPSKNYIWFLIYSYRKIFKFNYWWLLMNWWRSYALISMNFQYFLFLNYLINDKRLMLHSMSVKKSKINQHIFT